MNVEMMKDSKFGNPRITGYFHANCDNSPLFSDVIFTTSESYSINIQNNTFKLCCREYEKN